MSKSTSAPDSDTLARERASDPRHSVLLQAPAGSGKTTVLTERLLRLLREVDEPEEILAITFTRKAAAEMRARVLKALRGESDIATAQGARMHRFATGALERARQRGWDLANDPGRLRIQTIDSFNFRLASQLTVTAKAGGALLVTERPDELYRQAARRTLASAEQDPGFAADVALLFERLDNNWRSVERLLSDMLRQRGHWLRYVLGHEPGELCERIAHSLAAVVRDHLESAGAQLSGALRAQAASVPGVGILGDGPESLPAWKRLACLVLTVRGEWRKPKGINRSAGPEYESAAARDALKTAIGHLSAVPGLRESLDEIRVLPPAALSGQDAAAIEALSRVLRSAAAHLQSAFATGGRVDHTFVAGAARAALTDGGLPTDLALRTGLALRHILVDEFQDTSLAQFDLIEGLTVGWEEGDGRTLFVVGDPMQSIYQFREAEVGLFLRARDHGIGSVRLEPLQLTRNFRSAPELIEWNNNTFASLFPAKDDLRASAVSYTRCIPGRAAGGESTSAVRVRLFPDGRSAEAAAIARRITELKGSNPQASIAVLVASRSHAAPIMTELEASKVGAVGVDLVPLGELSIVRDLVALVKATSHLGDRTAWLAVLRAPWCGVSLATLTELARRGDCDLVWKALADEARRTACSSDDCARLNRVRGILEVAFATRNTVPLAEWVETVWLNLGAADAYTSDELRHARAFLTALSERVSNGEWSGATDLDSLAGDLFAQPQSAVSNPVQVMTIHRAKGLEFDHVFVPALDRNLNTDREPLLRWLDLPRAEGQSDLIMSPVPAIGDDAGGEVSAYLKRLTARRAANEQIRLMYVAATRARETLQLSAAPALKADGTLTPRSGTLLACVWPALGNSAAGSNTSAVSRDSLACAAVGAGDRQPPLRRLIADWSAPTVQSATAPTPLPVGRQLLEPPEFSWVRETTREVGTVVHGALERFATSGLPDEEAIRADRDFYLGQLRRHGVPQRELARAVETVLAALIRTVTSEKGRWIFARDHRDAHSEWALTGIAGGRLIDALIDRSFVDSQGLRWVIDFKTSRHEGGGLDAFLEQEIGRYRPQLEAYVALARGVGPEPVHAGLYFPLLDVFRELS